MTPQEILDYNARCAEFLGKDIVPTNEVGQMKFHSDWNWIMEMVEAIEKKEVSFKINSLFDKFNMCNYNQVSVLIEKGEMSKDRKVVYNIEKVYHEHSDALKDKKEAVVQSINQFLIWYNKNKQS